MADFYIDYNNYDFDVELEKSYYFGVYEVTIEMILCILDILLIIFIYHSPSFDYVNDLKKEIYDTPPIYDLVINNTAPSEEFIKYQNFYNWKGSSLKVNMEKDNFVNESVWINTIYKNQFYFKTLNKTYFDYLRDSAKEGENCKDNFKKCGILDTKNNILCIPEGDECPLNDILISEIELPDLIPEYSFVKVEESLTNATKYYTNNKTENKIITHFELSADYPCILPYEHNWIAVYANELEKTCHCMTNVNGNLHDPSYTKINDSILMKPLYFDHNITVFEEYNILSVNMYHRNYYYLDENCVKEYIIDFDNLQKNYLSKITPMKILQFIKFGIVLIFILYYFVYALCCKELYNECLIINLIISSGLILYEIIVDIIFLVFIYGDVLNFKCGGVSANGKIDNFFNNKFNFQTLLLIFFIIEIVFAIIQFVLNVFMHITRDDF